jgi:hypothetical protein
MPGGTSPNRFGDIDRALHMAGKATTTRVGVELLLSSAIKTADAIVWDRDKRGDYADRIILFAFSTGLSDCLRDAEKLRETP